MPNEVTLRETDDGKTIAVRRGDGLTLQLYENATTGYRWTLEGLDEQLLAVHDKGAVSTTPAVGSGGIREWAIEARASGQGEVRLKLARPWEGDASVLKRFSVTLVIAD